MSNCQKGYGCGNACISTLYECERYLSENLTDPIDQMAATILQRIKIVNPSISDRALLNVLDKQDQEKGEYATTLVRALEYIHATSTRSNGSGSASLSKDEVEALKANERRLMKLFKEPTEENQRADWFFDKGVITDEFINDLWLSMPSTYRDRLNNKGSVAPGHFWGPNGHTQKGTADRGKLILKKFLEQDAKDAYTGLPISLFNSDLEHIQPYGRLGSKAETSGNMCLISKSVNQTKGDKSMRKFFEEDVNPKSKWTDDQWSNQKEKFKKENTAKDVRAQLVTELARHPEQLTPQIIKSFGAKSYYLLREYGVTNYYHPNTGKPILGEFTKIGASVFYNTQATGDKEMALKIRDIFAGIDRRMSATGRSSGNGLGQTKEQVWREYFEPEMRKLGIDMDSLMKELNVKGY